MHQRFWYTVGCFVGTPKGIETDGFQNDKLWGLSKLAILVHQQFWCTFGCFEVSQGQISAQGNLHLWTPEPEFGAEFYEMNFGRPNLDPNSWVDFLVPFFCPAKEAPQNSAPQIHLPKFTFQNSTQKSSKSIHIAPLQGRLARISQRFTGSIAPCHVAEQNFISVSFRGLWGPKVSNDKCLSIPAVAKR